MEPDNRPPGATPLRSNERCRPVKLARTISYAMTLLGAAMTVAGAALDLSPVITLTGMLLVIAGMVKIGMVAIWKTFFALPYSGPMKQHPGSPPTRNAGEMHEV